MYCICIGSGFNTDYGSSEPLITLVIVCYGIVLYLYIYIALLAVQPNQKRLTMISYYVVTRPLN